MEEILKTGISGGVIDIVRSRIYTGCMIIIAFSCLYMCMKTGKVNDGIAERMICDSGPVAEEHKAFTGLFRYCENSGIYLAERKIAVSTEMAICKGAGIVAMKRPAVTTARQVIPDVKVTEDVEKISTDREEEERIEEESTEKENTIEIPGYIIDESGYITDIDVSLIDGLLVLPSDDRCKGILAGAFSGIAEEVREICIPANIVYIEPDIFESLTNLLYIEVMEGNPSYYSLKGILYDMNGTEVFCPPGRKKN